MFEIILAYWICFDRLGLLVEEEALAARQIAFIKRHIKEQEEWKHWVEERERTSAEIADLLRNHRELLNEIELERKEKTFKFRTAKLGPDHPETLTSMHNLEEALQNCELALELMQAKLGPDHSDTLACMVSLANCYTAFGRGAEAVSLLHKTVE